MILDGAVDPNADPIQADIDQAEAFQEAFNDYADDCATDPDCPLGTGRPSPSRSTATWWTHWWTPRCRPRTREA